MPVQARSVATRAALLDAALDCLIADGYSAVTTIEISRRAGVSRGAQLHHFPTKAELMTAAVEHLLERRMREFAAALATVRPTADRLDQAVDVVWSMFDGSAFIAWVELWVAARTDAELATAMIEVDRRFTEESQRMAVELLSDLGPRDADRLVLLRGFAFAVMTGVAVQELVPRGQRPASEYLDVLKQVAHLMLEAEPGAAS
jgi:AcrR family transcriptional regulator